MTGSIVAQAGDILGTRTVVYQKNIKRRHDNPQQ